MKSPYGKERYLDQRGESVVSQMRKLLALRWVRDTQPRPVVKFAKADPAKVAVRSEPHEPK